MVQRRLCMLQDVPTLSWSRTYFCPHHLARGAGELEASWRRGQPQSRQTWDTSPDSESSESIISALGRGELYFGWTPVSSLKEAWLIHANFHAVSHVRQVCECKCADDDQLGVCPAKLQPSTTLNVGEVLMAHLVGSYHVKLFTN